MRVIKRIAEWQHERLHLLVTSRKEREIEVSLEDIVDDQNTISLEREIVDKDIQKYVRERLANDKSLRKWQNDPGARIEIEKTLMAGAHGMYIYFRHVSSIKLLTTATGFAGLHASWIH